MPAHVPRRVFAKSFVITVTALPALALACHDDAPMSHNPPMPTDTATASTPSASATVSATATVTAAPTASVARTPPSESWTVSISGGKCTAMYDTGACPPGDSCNPPPPVAYPCPKEAAGASYPLTVTRTPGKQECTATFTVYGGGGNCPPNMRCNPPPPHQTTIAAACPK